MEHQFVVFLYLNFLEYPIPYALILMFIISKRIGAEEKRIKAYRLSF